MLLQLTTLFSTFITIAIQTSTVNLSPHFLRPDTLATTIHFTLFIPAQIPHHIKIATFEELSLIGSHYHIFCSS